MPTMPTTPTTPEGTRTTRPKPKKKLIRMTAGAMQKFCVNKLVALDHAKHALKRATKWYAAEKKSPVDCCQLRLKKR
jgi:hypothetical protein